MIVLTFSGGASNANSSASIGGIASQYVIQAWQGIGLNNLPGVTFIDADQSPYTDCVLFYSVGLSTTLQWGAGLESLGAAVIITGDGRYDLPAGVAGSAGTLTVEIVFAALPSVDTVGTLRLQQADNTVLDDINLGESRYVCLYVTNEGDAAANVTVKISGPITMGADASGVNGVAQSVASNETAPSGVTFSTANLALGVLAPGDNYPIWIKQTGDSAGEKTAGITLVSS